MLWKKPKAIAGEGNQQNYAKRVKQKHEAEIVTWNYTKSGTDNMGVSLWVSEKEKGRD